MAVHYKFNAAKDYDTLPIDDLHISLAHLKDAIIYHKKLGTRDLFDLKVTNAETKETYTDERALIPKNSSLIIARVPVDRSQKKYWNLNRHNKELLLSNPEYTMNVSDLTKLKGSEEEKISAMIIQSTINFHPSRYLKFRNTVMTGEVPPYYKCHKCHQGGHWIQNCPFNNHNLRKSSGIPSKFLMEVDDPKTPGAMITATGKYVVFRQSSVMGENSEAKVRPICPEKPPEELVCLLCKEMMQDAVLTPCCANAFCDDCIRNNLLESEDHTCPSCKQNNVSPDTIIPNRYLRLKIMQYGNQFYTEQPENSDSIRSENTVKKILLPSCLESLINSISTNAPAIIKDDSSKSKVINPINSSVVLNDERQLELKENKILEISREEKEKGEENDDKKETESQDDERFFSSQEQMKYDKKNVDNASVKGTEQRKTKEENDLISTLNSSRVESQENLPYSLMDETICTNFDSSLPPSNVFSPVSLSRFSDGYQYSTFVRSVDEDPLTAFERYLKEKDDMKEKRLRSQSSSRSPPYERTHSRPHQKRSYSRSRSRSLSKTKSPSWNSKSGPSPHSKRRYSPSSPMPSSRQGPYGSIPRDRTHSRFFRSPPYERTHSRPHQKRSYSRSRSRSLSKTKSPSWNRKSGLSPHSKRRYSPSSPMPSSRQGPYGSIPRDRTHFHSHKHNEGQSSTHYQRWERQENIDFSRKRNSFSNLKESRKNEREKIRKLSREKEEITDSDLKEKVEKCRGRKDKTLREVNKNVYNDSEEKNTLTDKKDIRMPNIEFSSSKNKENLLPGSFQDNTALQRNNKTLDPSPHEGEFFMIPPQILKNKLKERKDNIKDKQSKYKGNTSSSLSCSNSCSTKSSSSTNKNENVKKEQKTNMRQLKRKTMDESDLSDNEVSNKMIQRKKKRMNEDELDDKEGIKKMKKNKKKER